jgi:RHS repeat-associated protein
MSDGSRQTRLYSGPVRYRNAAGQWRGIARELVPGENVGDVVASSLPVDERFGEVGGAAPMAEISAEGWSVGMDLIGALPSSKLAVGDTVHYPGIARSTSLEYQTSATGMKDTLVLASADAPNTFQFKMTIKGLELITIPGVGPALLGPSSKDPVMKFGSLRVFDSSKPASGTAVCADAKMTVTPAPGGAIVTYTVPEKWLKDPRRVFPVRVDPSMNVSADFDTFVHSVGNTSEQDYSHWLYSGYDPAKGECSSLLYFDTTVLRGALIDSATLTMCVWSGATGSKQIVAANNEGWDPSIIYSDGVPASSALTNATVSASDYLQFNVTSAVQNWSRGIGGDNGFKLYSASPGDASKQVGYASSEADDPAERPVLTVSYPAPSATTAATATATGLSWYTSASPNDTETLGRGRVSLTWPAVNNATGYKIMAHDGSAWRQVGSVNSSSTTSWDTAASGIFPSDSTIASMPANNNSNAFVGAASPGTGSMITSKTISVPSLGSAGLVLTDGTYLYVRRYMWAWEGETSWKKVGTGFNGTTAGQVYGTIGGDLSGRGARSAFLEGGILWNGFTDNPSQLEGYSLDTGTDVHYRSFSKPLLNIWSGGDAGSYSSSVLVAADSSQIYSLAMSLGDGNDWGGFKVRVYDTDGDWIADHNLAMRSYNVEGFISDGSSLYLIGNRGDATTLVTKVRLSDWKVTNQFTLDQSNSQAPGCYDAVHRCFWLGKEWTDAEFYCYQGPGLDMRDDPRALYARSSGAESMDSDPRYFFKVVPYNADSVADIALCASATVTMPKRSAASNDDPRHTEVPLGALYGNEAAVWIDRGDLVLSTTDLSIPGVGPEVAISRTYRSSVTASPTLAFGWRFGFERSVARASSTATYTDEFGDSHVFAKNGDHWVPPRGSTDSLAVNGSGGVTLTHKNRSTTVFDATGRLSYEVDESGNAVHYEWTGSSLTIRSAKDAWLTHERRINVSMSDGRVTGVVAHVTGEVDRAVTYAIAPLSLTVTSFPSTAAQSVRVYRYNAAGRINAVAVPGFTSSQAGEAVWNVDYGSGSSIAVSNGTGGSTPQVPRTISWNSVSRTGTVVSATGTSTITYDPAGAEVSSAQENTAAVAMKDHDTDGNLICEVSPTGRTVTRAFDGRRNVVRETGEDGTSTTYQYSEGLCVGMTDARGAVTTRTYWPGTSRVKSEDKTVDATECSHVGFTYNTDGTIQSELRAIDKSGETTRSVKTEYGDYADCGEPQTMSLFTVETTGGNSTTKGIEVADGIYQSIVTHKYYDGFGGLTSTKDALGRTTATNILDSAGRVTDTTDASGTVTHTRYGCLGGPTSTWRTNAASSTAVSERAYDGTGNLATETARASTDCTLSTTRYVYDTAGRELQSDNSEVPGVAVKGYDQQSNENRVWEEGAATSSTVSAERTTFNAEGEEIASMSPGSVSASSHTTYTPAGLPQSETRASGLSLSYVRRSSGDVQRVVVGTDDGDAVLGYESNLNGDVVQETDSDGTTETTDYDLNGNDVVADLPGQPATVRRLNVLGWTLSLTDFDGGVEHYTYDANGNVVGTTVGGLTTTKSYDALGRLVATARSDGACICTTYDPFGDVLSVRESVGSTVLRQTQYVRDDRGRELTRIDTLGQWPGSRSKRCAYSPAGALVTSETCGNDAYSMLSTRDGTGLLRSWNATAYGVPVDFSVATTDLAGRVLSLASSALPISRTTTYTDAGQLRKITTGAYSQDCTYSLASGKKATDSFHFVLGGRTEADSYAYDVTGRLRSASIAGTSTTYNYNPVTGVLCGYRRTGETTVTLSYETSGTGRLVQAGNRLFASDGIGRRVRSGPSSNPSEMVYAWSAERLVRIGGPSGVATYTYDASGQRMSSVVTTAGRTTTTTFDYDGSRLLGLCATCSDGANWKVRYLYDGSSRPVAGVYASNTCSATPFSIASSDRGDVRELINASGASFALYSYDAYGNPIGARTSAAGSISATRAVEIAGRQVLRYAGYVWDSESSLYYCSSRYYDPTVAQFISKDPERADGEQSAHQYCGGDPVGTVDPDGRIRLTIFSLSGGAGNGLSSGVNTGGHAWLEIRNNNGKPLTFWSGIRINPGIALSVGTWGTDPFTHQWTYTGYTNAEPYLDWQSNGAALRGRISLTKAISPYQLSRLSEFTAWNAWWTYYRNCARYASEGWNDAKVSPRLSGRGGWLGLGAYSPTQLASNIGRESGAEYRTRFDKWEWSQVGQYRKVHWAAGKVWYHYWTQ